jgi:MerR family copper efflux transcriptional regulator
MKIGELARKTGKTPRALHLYEEMGLLQPPERTEGGFRLYGPDEVARVYWIAKLQDMGFSLPQIQACSRPCTRRRPRRRR